MYIVLESRWWNLGGNDVGSYHWQISVFDKREKLWCFVDAKVKHNNFVKLSNKLIKIMIIIKIIIIIIIIIIK